MTLIIALAILLLCIFLRLSPVIRKRLSLVQSNYITIKTKAKLVLEIKIMKKYGTCIGFIIGFLSAWFLFKWYDGLALITLQDTAIWLRDKFVFISPYGRVPNATESFLYVLNWSSAFCFFGFVFFLVILLIDMKFFFTKIIIALCHAMLLWYLMFATCFLIIKIPVFFKVLAPIAVCVVFVFFGFLLLMSIMGISDKLD